MHYWSNKFLKRHSITRGFMRTKAEQAKKYVFHTWNEGPSLERWTVQWSHGILQVSWAAHRSITPFVYPNCSQTPTWNAIMMATPIGLIFWFETMSPSASLCSWWSWILNETDWIINYVLHWKFIVIELFLWREHTFGK